MREGCSKAACVAEGDAWAGLQNSNDCLVLEEEGSSPLGTAVKPTLGDMRCEVPFTDWRTQPPEKSAMPQYYFLRARLPSHEPRLPPWKRLQTRVSRTAALRLFPLVVQRNSGVNVEKPGCAGSHLTPEA